MCLCGKVTVLCTAIINGILEHLMSKPPHPACFQEAATVPTVLMTAEAALVGVANMRPGETVLLHAAAGGVGLAGLQVR